METRVVIVGIILCLLGLILFVYGVNNMGQMSAVSSFSLVVIGVLLGIAGMLMLTNLFPSFSAVA